MTSSLFATETETVDPTGLRGQRLSRNESRKPHIEICWVYSSQYSIEVIRQAWKALPRQGRTIVMAVTEFKKAESGRRFVKVDLIVDVREPVHIDEPNI